MDVRPVDPRDIGIGFEPLTYRVYFWEAKNISHDGIESTFWTSYEYEMTQARDVAEVIEWANENAAGRTYTLYAVFMMGSEKCEIQLLGIDPTRHNG